MDRIDDAYNGLMGEEFMRKTRERLHWIFSKVVGERILDVGCSQGTLARLLAQLGKSVLGVDINKDAISYAEGKLTELDAASRERLQFVAMNFMDFKSEEKFDTVVMGEILEHLPDPAAFVKKSCTHLVKGGTIVATVPFGINDDPDHRQTFYWTWIRDIVAPLFDVRDIEFFGKWIGVVGTRRERRATVENVVPIAIVKELEKAFFAIERPLVDDNKARGLKLKAQSQDLAEAKKGLASKAAEAQTALTAETAQKARADKAVADYAKLKTDLSSEIARQNDALAKVSADKAAVDAAAAKQKTVLEGEVARQKTALAAEQAKVKDLNSKLAATRGELAATKNEALELRVALDADRRISDGQAEQISVLKAALQFAANRPQVETNDTRLLEYSQEVRELRSALESKRDEAVERAERLGHLLGQVESLKAEKELLSSRVAELTATLAAERETVKSKDAEIAARDALVAEANDYAKLCEGENTKLAEDNKALVANVEALKAEKNAIAESLRASESENERKDAAIHRIASERTDFEQRIALLRDSVSEKDRELEDARREIKNGQSLAEGVQDELNEAKRRIEGLSGSLERSRDDAAQAKRVKAEVERRLARCEEDVKSLERQLDVQRRAMEMSKADLDVATKREEEVGNKFSQAVVQLKQANAKIAALDVELAKAKVALSSEQKKTAEQAAALKQANDACAAEGRKAAATAVQVKERDVQVLLLRKENENLATNNRKLKKRLHRAEFKYQNLANAKLGRLTLSYWHFKDWLKGMFQKKQNFQNAHASPSAQQGGMEIMDDGNGRTCGSECLPIWSCSTKDISHINGFRILFPCGSGNNPGANPFVGTLMDSLKTLGFHVFYGAERLFRDSEQFEIVHFMWPEALFGWAHEVSSEMIAQLEHAIKRHKDSGAIIAYTRHNVRPHVDDNPLLLKAYDIVENSADLIFHMGEYSLNEFKSRHPKSAVKNVVVPHHTYSRISRSITKKEARDWFGLSENDKVVLSFGVFRSDEERELLRSAIGGCGIKDLKVIAPRFSDNPPPEIISISGGRAIPEQILPMYFAAADVVFIQRCHILNSGNVPMAFYFGCACVGPDDGNVGEILKATGNPVFNPDQKDSAAQAIVKAFSAIEKYNRGIKNKKWADKYWNQESVAAQIMDAYKDLYIERKTTSPFRPRISVIVVNGTRKEKGICEKTLASVKSQTYPSELVEVIESPCASAGLRRASGELVSFLFNGDELSPQFLEYARIPFQNKDVDCVVLKWSMAGYVSPAKVQAYVDRIISRCEDGLYVGTPNSAPVLGSIFGRLFRKKAIDMLGASIDLLEDGTELLLDSRIMEQIAAWRVYLLREDEYLVPSGHRSEISLMREIDRICDKLFDLNVPARFKRIYMGRMQMLTDRLCVSINSKPRKERAELLAKVIEKECRNKFFNRSLFSQSTAIAFCHNFPPAIDASSFVSAKRLREIDSFEGGPLNWTVISQDMRTIRPLDVDFQIFYADAQVSRHVELKEKFGFAPILQEPYAKTAVEVAEAIGAEVIYSRAFFVGSHMAAYQYKKKHPEVKWYAEFSDPIAYAVDNTVRPCPDKGLSWFDTERMVYELADVVIFTNEKQRAYMLGYNPHKEMNDAIMRKSIIAYQPILPHEYCRLTPYSYSLDKSKINIGYFGTFYKNRTGDDMLQLLANTNIVLHVFTTKPEEMAEQCIRFGDQIKINHTVSHLEFLNLGSQFDYLFLNDATFVGGDNPFLPSKYADYTATGTPIIAKVQKGSTLSEMEKDHLLKVDRVTSEFALRLRKRKGSK